MEAAHSLTVAPESEERAGTGPLQPLGAEVQPGGAHFRVWAPRSKSVAVVICDEDGNPGSESHPLEVEPDGFFSAFVPGIEAGVCYKLRLDHGDFPDPVSRFQPQGPHGPSQVIDPSAFPWSDSDWPGPRVNGQVIYEMHVGTFTQEGTWKAATEHLEELARLGVTILEIMPVAEFPGRFGWGYDGVNFFAPTRLYGKPDDFRSFVDRAHAKGLGVILDVVYNHFGPDGCYLAEFSPDYFSERYKNEWGNPLNFDGPNCEPVRRFFLSNAEYWIREFHLDGLRFDATQQIFDSSDHYILADIAEKTRAAAGKRRIYLVGENECQETNLLKSTEEGGSALDSLWNDDFHHSARAALTGKVEAYYSDYRGTPQEFVSSAKYGYLYQGQRYEWQDKPRGTPTLGLGPERFVHFLQNHDQIANSLDGRRLHELASPGDLRALTALLLLGPQTPMLFQGQEFSASAPFFYFADHQAELAKNVTAGRRHFLEQFPSIATVAAHNANLLTEPNAEETFLRCKLDHSEKKSHSPILRLHADLIALRARDPVFSKPRHRGVDGAVLGPQVFMLRFFGENDDDRLLIVNLGTTFHFTPAPEPLIAPVRGCGWRLLWSSDDISYGGQGPLRFLPSRQWIVPGHAATVFAPSALE